LVGTAVGVDVGTTVQVGAPGAKPNSKVIVVVAVITGDRSAVVGYIGRLPGGAGRRSAVVRRYPDGISG